MKFSFRAKFKRKHGDAIGCRKTKTEVITPANNKKHNLPIEPISASKRREARENECK